jgi:hypothetical protein
VSGTPFATTNQESTPFSGQASSSAGVISAGADAPGPLAGLLPLLLRAAKPVHGSWGSGRLLRTSLLSVLITNHGRVLVGAVTPGVLYADAAKLK